MIRLQVVNDEDQHFIVQAGEPVSIEVSVVDGRVLTEVYAAEQPSSETDPIGAYDGSNDRNTSWLWGDDD